MDIWDEHIAGGKEKTACKRTTDFCPQPGKFCPICKEGILEYDGKLNLVCPACRTEFTVGYT